MMTARFALILPFLIPLSAPCQEPPTSASPAAESTPIDGLWPSENLARLLIIRWIDEAASEYELGEDQVARARQDALDRWPQFMRENRPKIQPIINEFIEMRMEMEPPSKERVQQWASRALPALDMLKSQLEGATDDFRKVLNPLQKAKFESEVLQLGVGMMAAEAKLKQWQTGDYTEREFWEPTQAERRKRRAERQAEREGSEVVVDAAPEPVDQVAKELEAWDHYVEQFIKIYKLDEAQQSTARSCLKELKQRAVSHRDHNRDRIAKLEERIANHSGSKEELAEIKKQLVEIYGPIDDMFNELKERLKSIPSKQQRDSVADKDEKNQD